MNRRSRVGEVGLAEVERNLAPFRPHVELQTSPGGESSLLAPPGEKTSAQGIGAGRSGAPLGGPLINSRNRGEEAPFEGAVSSERVDLLRRDALEALHTYVVAASGYNLPRSMSLFRRVTRVLDSLLDPVGSERSRPTR